MLKDLKDLENVLAAHASDIAKNWCLVYASFCDQTYEKYRHIWLNELYMHLKTSITAIRIALSRYSDECVCHRINEVYLKDYLGNDYNFIYDDLAYEFLNIEKMPRGLLENSVRAWVSEGFTEVVLKVLPRKIKLYDYIVNKELGYGS